MLLGLVNNYRIRRFVERADEHKTPDIAHLEQYHWQLLFVYDSMMLRHPKNELLGGEAIKLANAYSVDNFSLWRKKLGLESYPIPVTKQFSFAPFCRIKGELWAVRPYRYIEIDKLKNNGVHFRRERVRVIIPYRAVTVVSSYPETLDKETVLSDERVHIIKAWMHVGNYGYWSELIDAGYTTTPVQHFIPKVQSNVALMQYYYFTKKEYVE